MVVVDSSVLIPLAWVGELGLIDEAFEVVETTEQVRDEVGVSGKRGAARLREFLGNSIVHPVPDGAERLASLEGISQGDASVVLLAEERSARLLANDKALIEIARSRGIECWWLTTLLLHSVRSSLRTADEANKLLYNLVDAGMNLHPQVYTKVQRAIENLGN